MRTVMIVDDDQSVIQGLLHHVPWDRLNIRVLDTAENGEEAWKKIQAQQPDMLITDIYMPKMDGLELIEKLWEAYPSVHIIIHSGYDDFHNARQAMRFGVQHFLLKPCKVSEIEAVLNEITGDMEAQEKQQKLLKHYNQQMSDYLSHTRDAFLREMLITKYKPQDISAEKLEMLQLPQEASIVVASLSLIRPPYLTRSKEREWQLMKFGAGNIIQELIREEKKTNKRIFMWSIIPTRRLF